MCLFKYSDLDNGTNHIQEAKDVQNEEELATVKSVINKISLQNGTAGVFTPATTKTYGTPAKDVLAVEDDSLDDWYILSKEDLAELGLNYIKGTYVANYKSGSL